MEIAGSVERARQDAQSGVLSVPSVRHPVLALLRLDFERVALTGRTVLAASRQDPPLKVVRAFEVEDGAALVHLHNVSGGLLGGDRLELVVNVGMGAQVQITTTGATRVYRPRTEALGVLQLNEIAVAENGLLEYLPDAVIPFAGARFAQRTLIRLAAGAGLFWWELLAPGREARGESFQYESVELKTDLMAAGRLVAAERVRLDRFERIGRAKVAEGLDHRDRACLEASLECPVHPVEGIGGRPPSALEYGALQIAAAAAPPFRIGQDAGLPPHRAPRKHARRRRSHPLVKRGKVLFGRDG